MDKKMVISIGIVGCILLSVGVISYVLMNQSLPQSSQKPITLPNAKKELSKTEKEYTDPSGFTFNYADNLSLEKKESTDSATYATIVLTEKDMSGNTTINVADTKIKTTDDWLTQNKYASGSAIISAKTLGTLAATEVKTKEKIVLAAIDKGVLFTIATSLGKEQDYWKQAYTIVSSSFSFVSPQAQDTGSSPGSSQGGGDISIEEDTVE